MVGIGFEVGWWWMAASLWGFSTELLVGCDIYELMRHCGWDQR